MSIIEIFLLVLIIVTIVLVFYLIISLKKINSTLDLVQDDLKILNDRLEPILENVNVITTKAANISDETEKRVLDISQTIQNVRSTVSNFSYRGKRGTGNKGPIHELLNNVGALSKGISAFWNKFNN